MSNNHTIMEENAELKNVKAMLRSVMMSVKEGVPATRLNRDYQDIVGDSIPYKKFGFATFEQFILSIPDVVKIERRGPEVILHAVADESTSHIKALVSKQRSKKVKKPPRRPRGGGAGRFMGRPVGPRPGPGRGGPRTPFHPRHGIPTFISPPHRNSLTPVMVSFGIGSSGRTVAVGRNYLLNRAMQEANRDSLIQRPQQSPSGSRYERPPRFQRKLGQGSPPQPSQQQQKPAQSTPLRAPPQQSLSTMEHGERYIALLNKYLQQRQQPLKFETTTAAGGYASSVAVNKQSYGSGDIFRSASEAEAAAALTAVKALGLDKQSQDREETGGLSQSQLLKVKSRVKEILQNKKNGLWGTRIPHEYKEKYKEEPPADLMKLIKSWTDIAKVEFVPNTDRDIVYPVQEDENKENDHVPQPNSYTPKSVSIPNQVRKSAVKDLYGLYEETKDTQCSVWKNLEIPKELLITSDEGVTVYMSYMNSPSYFCIQREDSCIEEITEALQTHCKSAVVPNADLLEKGRFCAGIYSGDGAWTRAEILQNKKDGTVELLFVDYGNIECTKVQDVRWLSPDLAKHPAQATTCSLYGIQPLKGESGWSDAASDMFCKQVTDQALIAVPRNLCGNVLEVLLYLKSDTNKSVNEKLLDAGLVLSTVSEEDEDDDGLHPVDLVLPEDKEWDVHVTYISSTTESVMLRLVGEEYSDRLDNFQAKLQEAFRNSSAETPLQLDRTYIAYDDGLYHRVRVISQDEKRVQCYFLDHGDADELLPEQLHPIDPQINKLLPYQAVEVSLYGLEEVSSNITALEKICDLALGKTCVAEVVEREDISSVILYDTSGDVDININEMILRTIEAEGGGIGSSSSTPKRVLSPAISASDVTSSTSDQRASASDLKSSLNDVQSNTLASQSNVLSKSESNRKVDQNSNPLYSDLNSNSVPAVERLTNSLQNSKIQDDYYNPSLQRVSPLRQSTNDTVDAGYNTSDMLNSSSQQSISRPILGRSPGGAATGAAAGAAGGAATGVSLEEILPRPFKIPPVGEFLDVHISFVHDPSNFVCLPYHEMNNLNMLLMDMLDFYSTPIQQIAKSDIEVGKLYAGHKDEVWYRVKVSALVGTDLVSVYLVDIGEYSVMMISELRPLVDQFRQLPMMAINACLGSITPESGSWYESAKYLFIKLAREKDLVGLVQGCDEKTGIVNFRLIDTSNDAVDLCIDEVLVKKQFARHKDK